MSITQRAAESEAGAEEKLFEIEEDVHCAFGGVGLQPVADVFVVDRQLAEDLRLMGLQFGKQVFELGFVKDGARLKRPDGIEFAFGGRGNSGENHFAEVILRTLVDGEGIGDGVVLIVEGGNGIE